MSSRVAALDAAPFHRFYRLCGKELQSLGMRHLVARGLALRWRRA